MKKYLKLTVLFLLLALSLSLSLPALAASLTFTNINVAEIDNDELKISWATNEPAQGWLQIRTSDSSWAQTVSSLTYKSNHEITVTLPQEKTTYYYLVIAEADNGQRITSLEFNIKIDKFEDTKKPEFSQTPKILYTDASNAIIVWQTNEKTNGEIWYSLNSDLSGAKRVYAREDKNFSAKASLSRLSAQRTYFYQVVVVDEGDNETKSAILYFNTREQNDEQLLRILNLQPLDNNSGQITDSSAHISFTSSRPAVCDLLYGLKGKGKKRIEEIGWGSLNHNFIIDNLTSGSDYAYYLDCKDILSKRLKTDDTYFRTKSPLVLGYEYNGPSQSNFYGQKYELVKEAGHPEIYAIVNKQKYLIKSPTIFNSYGFKWSEIKTVTQKQLDKYPLAKLVKTPDNSAVYFLYYDPQRKKVLLTEKAFKSYRNNSFSKVITVSPDDLHKFNDIVLVKNESESTVYLIQGALKRPVKNMTALINNGLADQPIGLISKTDLDSYQTGTMIE